jgi:adenylate cyclase
VRASHLADRLEAEIPLAGLDHPGSQLAVPIMARGRLLGVLCLEAKEERRFGYDEEDAMVAFAQHLGLAALMLEQTGERHEEQPRRTAASHHVSASAQPSATKQASGKALVVRHYPADDTIFVDDDYLIKGVAGAILWKMLNDFSNDGRSEFSNRELRLDTGLPLPDLSSNLEARLILLKRRLDERCPHICMVKTARGRFRLRIERPLRLMDVV